MSMGYLPFGADSYNSGNLLDVKYKFTGQEEDGSGLYYYGARYYDPELGRFVQADQVLDGLNRYAYCGNNPVKYVDPTGETYYKPGDTIHHDDGSYTVISANGTATTYRPTSSNIASGQSSGIRPTAPGEFQGNSEANTSGGDATADSRLCTTMTFPRFVLPRIYLPEFYLPGEIMPGMLLPESIFADPMYYGEETSGSIDWTNPPRNPGELGPDWEDVTNPDKKKNTDYRDYKNKGTDEEISYHPGDPNKSGWRSKDHWHRHNPRKTGKRDMYLDKYGNPMAKGSPASHIDANPTNGIINKVIDFFKAPKKPHKRIYANDLYQPVT